MRDDEATTEVSSFKSIDEFGPLLRQEAIRRGLGGAGQGGLLIDGAVGLENRGHALLQRRRANRGLLPRPGARRPRARGVDRQAPSGLEAAAAALGQTAAQKQSPGLDQRAAPTRHWPTAGRGRGASLGLFRPQREPEAIRPFPGGGRVHRFGRGGSRLQDRDRRSVQASRQVLVKVRSRKHPRPALPS